jgi:hypothetical protein
MFGLFKKQKPAKPANALDAFIFAVYGNPPPPKRADLEQAISLASELLIGAVAEQEIRSHAIALNDGPIPYSTHDLALSVALNFFKQPDYIPHLFHAQLLARMTAGQWFQGGLVVRPLAESFEEVLYTRYKPAPPSSPKPTPKPIPAADDQRHELIRRMIVSRVGAEAVGGDINEVPLELILSTADSAIFIIVEQYYMFRDRGLDEVAAVKALNESQATTLALIGQQLPFLSYAATLFQYARHFIDSQFSHAEPISDEMIRAEIEVVKAFYGRGFPAAPYNSAPRDSVPDPLIAEAHALFEQRRSERPNEPLVPDGSSFDRSIVLEGAILGPLAAFVIHEYLNEHYPGYKLQRSAISEHAGRSFDVIDFTTADGKSKTLYFALSKL